MKETIHISVKKENEKDLDLITSLLKSDGWEVDYKCELIEYPHDVSAKLIRTNK